MLGAPHGGVFALTLIGNPLGYIIAIVTGTLVSAALVIALKSARHRDSATTVPTPSAVAA